MESVWRQTGVQPKELRDLVELPNSCVLVWKYFMSLHSTRTSNGFGANPITFTEMKNYFDLVQVEPEEWEIDLIKRFDNVAMDAYEKAAEKNAQNK